MLKKFPFRFSHLVAENIRSGKPYFGFEYVDFPSKRLPTEGGTFGTYTRSLRFI